MRPRRLWTRRVRDQQLRRLASGTSELGFNMMWGDLATYNSEKSRGLVHTEEWKAAMAEKQERYNEWAMENLR